MNDVDHALLGLRRTNSQELIHHDTCAGRRGRRARGSVGPLFKPPAPQWTCRADRFNDWNRWYGRIRTTCRRTRRSPGAGLPGCQLVGPVSQRRVAILRRSGDRQEVRSLAGRGRCSTWQGGATDHCDIRPPAPAEQEAVTADVASSCIASQAEARSGKWTQAKRNRECRAAIGSTAELRLVTRSIAGLPVAAIRHDPCPADWGTRTATGWPRLAAPAIERVTKASSL